MTRGLTKCKETAEGSSKGYGLIVLKMNCLCVSVGVGVIWLISSVIALLAKKAQRTHEEVTKKAGAKCVIALMNIGMRFKNVLTCECVCSTSVAGRVSFEARQNAGVVV